MVHKRQTRVILPHGCEPKRAVVKPACHAHRFIHVHVGTNSLKIRLCLSWSIWAPVPTGSCPSSSCIAAQHGQRGQYCVVSSGSFGCRDTACLQETAASIFYKTVAERFAGFRRSLPDRILHVQLLHGRLPRRLERRNVRFAVWFQ